MAANNASVIDELCVRLVLDDEPYRKSSKKIDGLVDATAKKQERAEKQRKERSRQSLKQNAELEKSFKALSGTLGKFAVTVGGVLGVGGGAAGLVGLITGFAGVQNGLTRLGIATGASNRSLQSWGIADQALGADAESAKASIAGLLREQQAMKAGIAGAGPQLSALASIGVRIGPDTKLEDALGQAQTILRNMPEGQRNGAESRLAMQGVSADVLQMLKSEKDIRGEFATAYAQTSDANKKAVDAVNSALASLSTTAGNLGNTLATLLEPEIKAFADWATKAAGRLADFANDVQAAGGGLDGFEKALRKDAPEVAEKLGMLQTALKTLGEAVDVSANGLKLFGEAAKSIGETLLDKLAPKGTTLRENIDKGLARLNADPGPAGGANAVMGGVIADWFKKHWPGLVADAERNGPAPIGNAMGWAGGAKLTAPRAAAGGGDLISMLVAKGFSLPEALGVAANWQRESGIKADAFNDDGKGKGAQGAAQWRGPRIDAYVKQFGHEPRFGTLAEQVEFMTSNPAERALLAKARVQGARRGGSAADYTGAFSDIYEVPSTSAAGLAAERDARVGLLSGIRVPQVLDAQAMIRSATQQAPAGVAGVGAGTGGPTFQIGQVTVQASNPQQFGDAMQRVSNTSSYGSAVR